MAESAIVPKHDNPIALLEDMASLLQDISNSLQQQIATGQADDYTFADDKTLAAAGGNFRLEPPGQLGWILIPNIPCPLNIWGEERAKFIGSFVAGQNVRLQVPKAQKLYVEYPTLAAAASITVWYSSRPIYVPDARPAAFYRYMQTHDVNMTFAAPGTPQTAWAPATGKRFVMAGYSLYSGSATADFLFLDSATQFFRARFAAVPGNVNLPNGYLSITAGNPLKIDISAGASTIVGTIYGFEI